MKLPDDIVLAIMGARGKEAVFREPPTDSCLPQKVSLGHVDPTPLPTLPEEGLCIFLRIVVRRHGLPPLEATASGGPVLSGNVCALPRVLDDGAMCLDFVSIGAIADGLERISLARDARERPITRGPGRRADLRGE